MVVETIEHYSGRVGRVQKEVKPEPFYILGEKWRVG